ncbi:MAG TPA: SEC-C metal-binding domain-containing protein [Mariprofundaceae bacterium]|nr:SEC-C metal-binding domain-containing protein [Mariprofundaceae bacterium]
MGHKIQRNAPCPCGSGKKYKQCCGQNEKQKSVDRAANREGIQKSLGWISRNFRPQIDQWVESVWLDDINKEERAGIASADPRIRSIHDINLLEYLVSNGCFADTEGENKPLELILHAEDLQLDEGQRSYIRQLAEQPLRLYRVSACQPGESFSLEHYPSDDTQHVTIEDKWASRMFDIGDVVGLRLMQSASNWETSGAIYHIPDEYVEDLQLKLQEAGADEYGRTLIHYWLGLVAAHV